MKESMIPAEVIAHFDTKGVITPYRIRYKLEDNKIIYVTKLLKRNTNITVGNIIETFECVGIKDDYEIIFVLKFEKKLNQWFLTKL